MLKQLACLVGLRRCRGKLRARVIFFMDSFKGQWYQQQTDGIADALQELLTDDDPSIAIKGLSDAIASWEDYHEKELAKWKRLRALLAWETGTES